MAVAECLRNYNVFSGRSTRSEYWPFMCFVVLVALVAAIIDAILFGAAPSGVRGQPFSLLAHAVLLPPTLAAGWRRMHDAGRPGWLLLPPTLFYLFATFARASGGDLIVLRLTEIGLLALAAYWLTRRSDRQENLYGAPAHASEPQTGSEVAT